jgi:REP element-mobilizing transposase RayT
LTNQILKDNFHDEDMKSLSLEQKYFKNFSDRFGGSERKTRRSRQFRPLSTKFSMHLILKSEHARGAWSFLAGKNKQKIKSLITDCAVKYGVKVLSAANVGNHLHLHIKIHRRWQYIRFIRVLTAKIAFAVTGANKFKPILNSAGQKISFWTQRPLTRFVHSWKDFLSLKDYIQINTYEGLGWSRQQAEFIVKSKRQSSG